MLHVFSGKRPDGVTIWIVDLVEAEGSYIMDVSTEKPSIQVIGCGGGSGFFAMPASIGREVSTFNRVGFPCAGERVRNKRHYSCCIRVASNYSHSVRMSENRLKSLG
jgi:hypothetical protein